MQDFAEYFKSFVGFCEIDASANKHTKYTKPNAENKERKNIMKNNKLMKDIKDVGLIFAALAGGFAGFGFLQIALYKAVLLFV